MNGHVSTAATSCRRTIRSSTSSTFGRQSAEHFDYSDFILQRCCCCHGRRAVAASAAPLLRAPPPTGSSEQIGWNADGQTASPATRLVAEYLVYLRPPADGNCSIVAADAGRSVRVACAGASGRRYVLGGRRERIVVQLAIATCATSLHNTRCARTWLRKVTAHTHTHAHKAILCALGEINSALWGATMTKVSE